MNNDKKVYKEYYHEGFARWKITSCNKDKDRKLEFYDKNGIIDYTAQYMNDEVFRETRTYYESGCIKNTSFFGGRKIYCISLTFVEKAILKETETILPLTDGKISVYRRYDKKGLMEFEKEEKLS
jgi:antitoxin component YwqK of YwqJK toxin-antitoxin module